MRCAEHKAIAVRTAIERSAERHREKRLAGSRRYYQENEERRRARNEYKRAYRKAHPEKVRAYKRREALRQNEHRLEWHRKYNRRKARILRKRQLAKLAYYRANPTRPAPKCAGCDLYLSWQPLPGGKSGRPPKWCDGCAPKYEKLRRERTGRSIPASSEPLVSHAPSLRSLEVRVGLRTCLTPTCDVVLTGRKKKCTKCKERESEEARRLLGDYAPRLTIGPRTATQVRDRKRHAAEYEHISNQLANGWTVTELSQELKLGASDLVATLQRLGGDLLERAYANSFTPRADWTKPQAVSA